MKRLLLLMVVSVLVFQVSKDWSAWAQESAPTGTSEARKAASRVVAVADEQTNSLVVSAPEELMPLVEDLIKQIDTVGDEITEVRVFPLRFSNAEEMAELITNVFEEQSPTETQRFGRGRFQPPQPQQSRRRIEEITVVAIADIRTNSVVVKAASETMELIEQMVKELDADPAKDRKVFIYSLENADAERLQEILQNMFKEQSSGTRSTTNQSTTRQSTSRQRGTSSQSSQTNPRQ